MKHLVQKEATWNCWEKMNNTKEEKKVSANQLPHLLLGHRNPKSLREQAAGES